jgi:phage-related protein
VDEVRAKIMMMQDESVGEFMKGFDNLITQGKNLIRSIYSAALGLEVLSI